MAKRSHPDNAISDEIYHLKLEFELAQEKIDYYTDKLEDIERVCAEDPSLVPFHEALHFYYSMNREKYHENQENYRWLLSLHTTDVFL